MIGPARRPGFRALLPFAVLATAFSVACSSSSNKPVTAASVSATVAATSATVASTVAATRPPTAAATTAAASPAAAASAAAPGKVTKVAYVPNWFAEPENGGELMAKLLNYYPPDLDVTINNGGPGVNRVQQLQTGQIQFTLCAADEILTFKEQGIELVGLLAGFQVNPQMLMAHKDAGIKGFEDMKGKPVAVSAFQYYYPYLQKKYGWNEADKLTYTGSIADFLANNKVIEQGYITAEPYLVAKQNQQIDTFLISDGGFNPYASVLCGTKDYVQKNPTVVKEFVQAAQKGWQAMLKPENQKALSDEIAKRNEQEDAGSVKFALDKLSDVMLNDDTKTNGFGHMTDERWTTLMNQMVDTKVLKGPVDLKGLYTNEFLVKP